MDKRILVALAAIVVCALGVSCQDNDNFVSRGLTATFTSGSMPANSFSLQSVSRSGDTVVISVTATGVSDLYGAAFDVTYDTNYASYLSSDDSDSILRGTATDDQLRFLVTPAQPHGTISVVATRNDHTLNGVSGNGTVIKFSFRGVAATSASAFAIENLVVTECPPAAICTQVNDVTANGGTLFVAGG